MKIRSVVTFAVVLFVAAIGLAMTRTTNVSDWQPVAQDRPAPPQGRPPGPPPAMPGEGPGGIGRALFHLDLGAAQLEQVKELMQAEHDAGAPYHEALRNINGQMRAAVESGEFDETAVRALAATEAAATVELRVIGARTQAAIHKLLTDEQKKALADARDDQPLPRPRRGKQLPSLPPAPLKGGA
jgi:Spy/CpxP family protein refolding chaperone